MKNFNGSLLGCSATEYGTVAMKAAEKTRAALPAF
jgi:hypothetical protein